MFKIESQKENLFLNFFLKGAMKMTKGRVKLDSHHPRKKIKHSTHNRDTGDNLLSPRAESLAECHVIFRALKVKWIFGF